MVRKRLDVLMVILMIIVMSYQAVGNLFHEVAGAWGTILVSVHGGMHIRIPKERKAVLIVCGILLSGIGIWAFLAVVSAVLTAKVKNPAGMKGIRK